MPHPHEDIKAHRYYWEYVKRFGKESFEGFKRDFGLSIIVALVAAVIRFGDSGFWDATVAFLAATAIVFACFAIYHLFHVALLIFRERLHPENGGIRYVSEGYGVVGIFLLLAILAGVSVETYRLLLRRLSPVVWTLPAPAAPSTVRIVSPTKPEPANAHSNNSPPQTVPSQPTQPGPTVQNPPPQVAQQTPAPVTFLDRVVQENRALTPSERDKLSQELYAADKFLKQSQAVAYKLNAEFGKLGNDRQSGALAKNVDEHIQTLKDLEPAGWEQYHGLQKFQSDYQYFEHQTNYMFGDDPFNSGEGLLLGAIDGDPDWVI